MMSMMMGLLVLKILLSLTASPHSAGSQPKKTKVRSDLTDEEEEAMADWLAL